MRPLKAKARHCTAGPLSATSQLPQQHGGFSKFWEQMQGGFKGCSLPRPVPLGYRKDKLQFSSEREGRMEGGREKGRERKRFPLMVLDFASSVSDRTPGETVPPLARSWFWEWLWKPPSNPAPKAYDGVSKSSHCSEGRQLVLCYPSGGGWCSRCVKPTSIVCPQKESWFGFPVLCLALHATCQGNASNFCDPCGLKATLSFISLVSLSLCQNCFQPVSLHFLCQSSLYPSEFGSLHLTMEQGSEAAYCGWLKW